MLLLLLSLLVLVYPLRFCNLTAGGLLHLRDVRLDFLKPLRICSADVSQYGAPLFGRRRRQLRKRRGGTCLGDRQGLGNALLVLLGIVLRLRNVLIILRLSLRLRVLQMLVVCLDERSAAFRRQILEQII